MRFKDLCEELDKTLRLDLGFRGIVDELYLAARSRVNKPLVQLAVELIASVEPKRAVIATGFKVTPKFVQETDGPLGALVLAQTLDVLGFDVLLLIEEDSTGVLNAGLDVLGLSCKVCPLPVNSSLAPFSRRLMEDFGPKVLIFVEKVGANDVGVYHTMSGVDVSRYHARVEEIIYEARRVGCKVMSVGDGGNEVGFGLIKEAVELLVPRARDCGCPCGRGIAASSMVDVLVVSSISNVGCYAISSALSAFYGYEWPHNHEVDLKLLKAIVDAGAVDGLTGEGDMKVDGVPAQVLALMVDLDSYLATKFLGKMGVLKR
ncbi:MAG: DUF4392 domain-containing protein [Candidatus Nezhaarchaeales archaeon]